MQNWLCVIIFVSVRSNQKLSAYTVLNVINRSNIKVDIRKHSSKNQQLGTYVTVWKMTAHYKHSQIEDCFHSLFRQNCAGMGKLCFDFFFFLNKQSTQLEQVQHCWSSFIAKFQLQLYSVYSVFSVAQYKHYKEGGKTIDCTIKKKNK